MFAEYVSSGIGGFENNRSCASLIARLCRALIAAASLDVELPCDHAGEVFVVWAHSIQAAFVLVCGAVCVGVTRNLFHSLTY